MWILQWLPDWIFYAILVLGLIGSLITYLLKFIPIPQLFIYRNPIQIVSVLLIVFGVYMAGSIANNEAWEARVREVQAKLAEAEVKAAQETVRIVEKVVVQQKEITEEKIDKMGMTSEELSKAAENMMSDIVCSLDNPDDCLACGS